MLKKAEMVHTNFQTWLKSLSDLTGHKQENVITMCAFISDVKHPMYNYLCVNTDSLVDSTELGYFLNKLIKEDIPFFYNNGIITPEKIPLRDELASKLDFIGYLDGMIFDLKNLTPVTKAVDDLSIHIVDSDTAYEEFARVMAQAAEIEPQLGTEFFQGSFNGSGNEFTLLTSYIKNEAVGCSMIYHSKGEVAGNYYDWVVPKYRNRGINSKMVIQRIEIAKRKGYKYLIAQCMDTSTRLYCNLGFEKVCELDFYGKMSY